MALVLQSVVKFCSECAGRPVILCRQATESAGSRQILMDKSTLLQPRLDTDNGLLIDFVKPSNKSEDLRFFRPEIVAELVGSFDFY